ncbi:ribosome biogenesis GTPase YqeH [Alkalihalobacillus sp. AL-G]|uniref:ribosome biogenesis GTPase YqeH n=1 Tax=Alkalihalobacillus sp. AL-G TaxID=2926399 RepID=UPI00272D8E73|nr:ribosome biogenesis GTPase YqeH [Alkalihalobacillus sp. AL-G]WLD92156.1 ribosome biogenesis GTPase YqeH [Alkalihalobacillus sp. AL-G]
MSDKLICEGCGILIQTEAKNQLGYAPPSALSRDHIICQRCFKLKHYNEVQDVSLTDDDYRKILSGIGTEDALVVMIVDIFDFSGSWLSGIHRFVGKNPILLVGNKMDLLPKSVNPNRIVHWMKHEASQLGVKPIDVELMSAAKHQNVEVVAETIEKYRKGKDVYIVGATNVGKSTFINELIKEYSEEAESLITTSHFPGTTLDLIEIPLDETSVLYDTPGIINHHQIAHHINKKDFKQIMPKKEIKPKIFQLSDQQTLFFAGLARFDYVSGPRQPFVCYVSNDLNIHRTKLEKADELYKNQAGKLLSPPNEVDLEQLPPMQLHEFSVKNGKTDIVFSGLGWVTISESNARVRAFAPKGVGVYIRPSLI